MTILYPGDMSERMSDFLENEFGAAMLKDLNINLKMSYSPWDQYWEKKSIMLAAHGAHRPVLGWESEPERDGFEEGNPAAGRPDRPIRPGYASRSCRKAT